MLIRLKAPGGTEHDIQLGNGTWNYPLTCMS